MCHGNETAEIDEVESSEGGGSDLTDLTDMEKKKLMMGGNVRYCLTEMP